MTVHFQYFGKLIAVLEYACFINIKMLQWAQGFT